MLSLVGKMKSSNAKLASTFEVKDFVILWIRVWIAKIFYDSGRSKAGEGFFEPSDFQAQLFEDEYGIDFIDPELMAQLALYMETLLPLALFFGLAARFGALGLIGMTLFIQVLVYPTHFMEHAGWFVALMLCLLHGPGKISFDHLISKRLK